MELFTRDLGFVNFNNQEMQWVKFNDVTVYEAWKKLIASGVPPLTLQKCKGVDLVDYKIYGESVQETRSGKNLLPFKDGINFTLKGINYSTKDGSLYLNGTSEGETYSSNPMFIDNFSFKLKAGTYTMSQTEGVHQTTYLDDEGGTHIATVNGWSLLSSTFTLKTDTIVHLGFYVYQATRNNFKVPIMLVRGNEKTEYEPYGVMPSPEFPSEIESVGDKTKNLLKLNDDLSQIINGVDIKVNKDGTITCNGLCTANIDLQIARFDYESKQYFCGGCPENGSTSTYRLFFNNVGSDVGAGVYRRSTGEFLNSSVRLVIQQGYECNNLTFKPMIVEGLTRLDYEPYGYRIPVKVSGKNLLNIPSDIEFTRNMGPIELFLEPGTYTLSTEEWTSTHDNLYSTFRLNFEDGTYEMIAFGQNAPKTITTTKRVIGYYIYAYTNYSGSAGITVNIKNMMMEKGDIATNYEPYVEPITTNIYLDEPLRKIGNYVDYIDFEKQKVVRNVGKYTIDGNTNWTEVMQSTGNTNYVYAYSTIFDKLAPNDKATPNSFSNKFAKVSNMAVSYSLEQDSITVQHESYGKLRLMILKSRLESISIASLKKWFGENNADLYYRLLTPTEEPIELPNIPTHKGTTIMEVDTSLLPSNMEATYVGKK